MNNRLINIILKEIKVNVISLIEKNYGRTVSGMYLVCLHPNNKNKNYRRIKVCDLTQEVNDLMEIRLKSITNDYSSSSDEEEILLE